MQWINLGVFLRNAVHADIQSHVTACKDHNEPWDYPESLNLLRSYLKELTDEQIKEEIEKRERRIKEIKGLQSPEEYDLGLELIVFRRIEKETLGNQAKNPPS
ncbi:MAG TPA: hypothetical protein VIJ14_00030 [Rhabdochlamydiaceae bacterium]